mgnify:CR=1 FL=1
MLFGNISFDKTKNKLPFIFFYRINGLYFINNNVKLNSKLEASLFYVKTASQRMKSTIKNMSDFSRINVYESKRINLNNIVMQSLSLVGNHIEKNNKIQCIALQFLK